MKAKIGIGLSVYWGSVAQVIDVLAAISALGAIGGLPTLINALAKYASVPLRKLRGRTRAAIRQAPCT
jgi:hypothetical protein